MKTGLMQIDPKAFGRTFAVKKMSERYKALGRQEVKEIHKAVALGRSENRSFYRLNGSTAIIPVVGMLVPKWDWMLYYYDVDQTSYEDIITAVEELNNNPMVTAIEFYFNSPGGYIDGSDETCETIFASGKPTTARVGTMCASAAYKLAVCCNSITASTNGSMVGSIGTVIETTDFSGWEEAVGIKTVTLTNRTSEEKRPNIAEESGKNVIRDELDDIQEVFESYITRGRAKNASFSIENARNLKGRTVTAKKALALGLIDNIGAGAVITGTENNSTTMEFRKGQSVDDLKKICSEKPELQKQLDDMIASAVSLAKPDAQSVAVATETAQKDERARMMSIIGKSGAQLSSVAMSALENGQSLADYAIAMLDVHGKAPLANARNLPGAKAPNAQADAQTVVDANQTAEKNFLDKI